MNPHQWFLAKQSLVKKSYEYNLMYVFELYTCRCLDGYVKEPY